MDSILPTAAPADVIPTAKYRCCGNHLKPKHVSLPTDELASDLTHLNGAMGTVHEETAHPRPSDDTLSQDDEPIAPLPLGSSVQSIETQTEIPQPSQRTACPDDDPMELCVEQTSHDERQQQRHKRLQSPYQPDARIRSPRQKMLVVVPKKRPETHNQTPVSAGPISKSVPILQIQRSLKISQQRSFHGLNVYSFARTYQQFAIPQNPDSRAAYGSHPRGHRLSCEEEEAGLLCCGWEAASRLINDIV